MLRARWQALREENPKLRIRDAADQLDVSEAALVALGVGVTATRLQSNWVDLLLEIHRFGPVMGLTRNDHAVHERHGNYGNLKILGDALIARDDGFEAALFLSRCATGFAVSEFAHGQARQSFQFFDERGVAVHKIYLTEHSRPEVFKEVVAQFRSADQSDAVQISPFETQRVNEGVDSLWSSRIVSDWPLGADGKPVTCPDLSLQSAAIQVEPLGAGAAEVVLKRAAELATPLVVVVGHSGAVQLHRGPIQKILRTGPWMNVLDDAFNLHLRDTQLTSASCIRELTDTGDVSLYWGDTHHCPVLQIFSEDRSGSWEACVKAAVEGNPTEVAA
jgi:putative hemin transport protein